MHIAQLKIKHFKSFESVTFELNPDLNVITGVNNSGKTTVLEAIALWAECFRSKIWRAEGREVSRPKGREHRTTATTQHGAWIALKATLFSPDR